METILMGEALTLLQPNQKIVRLRHVACRDRNEFPDAENEIIICQISSL